jgi:hypothetical protein
VYQAGQADGSTSVRVRACPPLVLAPGDSKEDISLQVRTEPRIPLSRVLGVRVERAIDDRGQKLRQTDMGLANPFRQLTGEVRLRLVKGEKPARSLRELTGFVLVEVVVEDVARPLVTVDRVWKAAGKTFKGKQGTEVKVLEVKEKEGNVIWARLEVVPPRDTLIESNLGGLTGIAGGKLEYELSYVTNEGAVPDRLVISGRRTLPLRVPFTLREVPLP